MEITKNTGGDSSQVKGVKKTPRERNQKPENNLSRKDEAPQNKKSWKRVQLAFFACFKFFPEGFHPAEKPEEVKASNTTNLCRRWQNAFPPPSFPQNPTTHSLQLLHLSFRSQHHSSTQREQLGENHCSCYLQLKSSFPYNLLELSWHFFPPTTKTARGGRSMCIWCRGNGKAQASQSLLCSAPPHAKH